MPYKDPEKRREQGRRYYANHREAVRRSRHKYYMKYRKRIKAKVKRYRAAHRKERREYYAMHREELRRKKREYYAIHRKKMLKTRRKYRAANREKLRAIARKCWAKKHGMRGASEKWRAAKLREQHNRCPICGRKFSGNLTPQRDRNHLTGALRGLLCSTCNLDGGRLDLDRGTTRAFSFIRYIKHYEREERAHA